MKNTLTSIIRLFIQLTMLFFAFLMLPENPIISENNIVDSTPEKDTIVMNTESAFYKVTPENFPFISVRAEYEQKVAINN